MNAQFKGWYRVMADFAEVSFVLFLECPEQVMQAVEQAELWRNCDLYFTNDLTYRYLLFPAPSGKRENQVLFSFFLKMCFSFFIYYYILCSWQFMIW